MNTNNDGWIKMTERKPTEKDYPAWLATSDTLQVHCFRSAHEMKQVEPLHQLYTHWQPAVLPAPPAKELTQREKDEEACRSFILRMRGDSEAETVWHAALAYRDAQNREDLRRWRLIDAGNDRMTISYEAYKNLAARCGLDT